MRKRDTESIFQRYKLIVEGVKEIQQYLLQFKDEDWYEDAYNTFSIRYKEAVMVFRRDSAEVLPQSWATNDSEKPLFTDEDAKHCVKWVASGTLINDILLKYIDYKRYSMQQIAPLTQFGDFIQFSNFVDEQKQQRTDVARTKQANSAATWEPEDIIFENDDLVILNGAEQFPYQVYDRDKVERFTDAKHCVMDFLILKHCKVFVGSNDSSFSLLLFYWRHCEEDYFVFGKF